MVCLRLGLRCLEGRFSQARRVGVVLLCSRLCLQASGTTRLRVPPVIWVSNLLVRASNLLGSGISREDCEKPVSPVRLEPTTSGLLVQRSYQLSYSDIEYHLRGESRLMYSTILQVRAHIRKGDTQGHPFSILAQWQVLIRFWKMQWCNARAVYLCDLGHFPRHFCPPSIITCPCAALG